MISLEIFPMYILLLIQPVPRWQPVTALLQMVQMVQMVLSLQSSNKCKTNAVMLLPSQFADVTLAYKYWNEVNTHICRVILKILKATLFQTSDLRNLLM